jgi:chemotaxis protein MotB
MATPKPAKQSQPQPVIIKKVKKVASHGGHHGGAWKVAYADFVTAMMALFLLLWLISQGDQKLKQAIANYFKNPGVFSTQRGGVLPGAQQLSKEPGILDSVTEDASLHRTAALLRKAFQSRPDIAYLDSQIKIDVTAEGLRLQIVDRANEVLFDSGSAHLKEAMIKILQEIAAEVGKLDNRVVIGGHTDAYTYKREDEYSNWELSADRANATRRVLEKSGLYPGQVKHVIGYGDTEPYNPADPYDPANRRISIIVLRRFPPPPTKDESGSRKAEGGS